VPSELALTLVLTKIEHQRFVHQRFRLLGALAPLRCEFISALSTYSLRAPERPAINLIKSI